MSPIAVSPDSRYLAQIFPDGNLCVFDLCAAILNRCHSCFSALPPKVKPLLSQIEYIRWSPERVEASGGRRDSANGGTVNISWLLLASASRLFVLELQIPDDLEAYPSDVKLIADIEFPTSHGKISAIDFVFDHSSMLVMFDIMPNASFLSLTNAQRDDLPSRKFISRQSYTVTEDTRSVAVLTRDKHTDNVAVFHAGQMVKSFKLDTIDAQGVIWSPDEKPVLCIWDAAAYGLTAQFYTAMGHSLKQFDLDSQSLNDLNLNTEVSGLGISAVRWSRHAGTRNNTTFAVGYSSKRIMMRSLNSLSMTIERSCSATYPEVLNGSTTTIWQQVDPLSYRQEPGMWSLTMKSSGSVEMISISADGQQIATVASDSANTVMIWQFGYAHPVSAIIFQNDVREILWHPSQSTTLIILLVDRTPNLHIWSGDDAAPQKTPIPKLQDVSSSKWQLKWLKQILDGALYHSLMISCTRYFDIGLLELHSNKSIFKSLFSTQTATSLSDESTLHFELQNA